MFSRTLRVGHRPTRPPVGADEVDAGGHRLPGERGASAAPSSIARPPVIGHEPEERAADLLLPGAAQADEPDDLAGMDRAVDRPDLAHRHALEHAAAASPSRCAGRRNTCDGSRPTMRRISSSGRRLADAPLAGDPAVAQDDHPVGDLEDLVEAVRDVDHADAARRGDAAAR